MERATSTAETQDAARQGVVGRGDVIECRRSMWPAVFLVPYTAFLMYTIFVRSSGSYSSGSSEGRSDVMSVVYIMIFWSWFVAAAVRSPLIITPSLVGIVKRTPFGPRIWISRSEVSRAYFDGLWITIQRKGSLESIDVMSVSKKYHKAVLEALNSNPNESA